MPLSAALAAFHSTPALQATSCVDYDSEWCRPIVLSAAPWFAFHLQCCAPCLLLQMLVEAETPDGVRHSTLLQNAETVRLVGPSSSSSTRSSSSINSSTVPPAAPGGSSQAGSSTGSSPQRWRAVSVSELQPGEEVYLLLQEAARHTGISIQERISEK
jgi:hypothetical protein